MAMMAELVLGRDDRCHRLRDHDRHQSERPNRLVLRRGEHGVDGQRHECTVQPPHWWQLGQHRIGNALRYDHHAHRDACAQILFEHVPIVRGTPLQDWYALSHPRWELDSTQLAPWRCRHVALTKTAFA